MQTLATSATDSDLLNRELSWLAFNERVLAAARDPRHPPLERLKFAAICGSNLDEFFMVRVAGIHRQVSAGVRSKSPDGLLPEESLERVRASARRMLADIGRVTRALLRELDAAGVRIRRVRDLGKRARRELREHYLKEIQPVLTPLVVDPGHPFPYLSNLSLNLAVTLAGEEGTGEDEPEFARVKVPVGTLPRLVPLGRHWLLLEDVIAEHLGELFSGREVLESHLFRVTRNTDYEFEEDEAEDLLATIEDGLRRRRFGAPVRLEVTREMPPETRDYLIEQLKMQPDDVYAAQGPLGTANLMGFALSLIGKHPGLAFAPHTPHVPALADEDHDAFDTLRAGDVLLHHPYDSFQPVLEFLETAANDPQVLAIKQTLYRTGDDPRLLGALRTAAENGKQVVAFIELKARFDEQLNISWARQLERAGAHVMYGLTHLKTHAKVALVVRREEGGLRRYVHFGTGNYNPGTARIYTDLSLMTADPELGEEASLLFNQLTGYARVQYRRMLVAPQFARDRFVALVEAEMERGEEGWIWLKMNQLTDPDMIRALQRASNAGVRVRLQVRGVCCLRPGVPGLSEHVEVRSLLGRFLEHARVYAFGGGKGPLEGGAGEVYLGSADWMSRNLNRRVETVVPVRDREARKLLSMLQAEWADERGSWRLGADGVYHKLPGERCVQCDLAEGLSVRQFLLRAGGKAGSAGGKAGGKDKTAPKAKAAKDAGQRTGQGSGKKAP